MNKTETNVEQINAFKAKIQDALAKRASRTQALATLHSKVVALQAFIAAKSAKPSPTASK